MTNKTLEKFVKTAQVISLLINFGVFLGSMPLVGYFLIKEEKDLNAYLEVRKKADINKDFCIDNQEWKKIYDFLKKDYNPNYSNPQKDLSFNEKKKYLNH